MSAGITVSQAQIDQWEAERKAADARATAARQEVLALQAKIDAAKLLLGQK